MNSFGDVVALNSELWGAESLGDAGVWSFYERFPSRYGHHRGAGRGEKYHRRESSFTLLCQHGIADKNDACGEKRHGNQLKLLHSSREEVSACLCLELGGVPKALWQGGCECHSLGKNECQDLTLLF